MPHFFFSYARQDAVGGFLDAFFQELCGEVRSLTGADRTDIGFRDTRDIELGEDWNDELVAALFSCRVFLALYSPSYFNREFCGREWQVFAGRVAAYGSAKRVNGLLPPLIIPVLWVPGRRQHPASRDQACAVQP